MPNGCRLRGLGVKVTLSQRLHPHGSFHLVLTDFCEILLGLCSFQNYKGIQIFM